MKSSAAVARTVLASTLLVATPLLAACSTSAAEDGKPRVVTSFYALQYVADRIVGDHASVTNLTHPGMEPHDLELTVQQTAQVYDADLVVYERGFQSAVDEAVDQSGDVPLVDAAEVAQVQDDPHFWLDPTRVAEVAEAVTQQMSGIDEAHADDYARNLTALNAELETLDAEYTRGLADCAIMTTVVTHDAFNALTGYGLEFVSINGLSPEAEPSPSHIRQVHDLIESDNISTVFFEPLASTEMADTIADDLGIKTAVLDPIEGLSEATSNDDYLTLMRANLAALRDANRCR